MATADLFPRVSLRGFIGFLSGGWGNLVNGDNRAWQVTPSISWAAFDMGSVRARLRASEAQADGVTAQYEKTVLGALEETENALLSYAKQQAQLKLRLEQSVAARRAAELAEVRYRAGSSDFLTLLDAQRTQLAADGGLSGERRDDGQSGQGGQRGRHVLLAPAAQRLVDRHDADVDPSLGLRQRIVRRELRAVSYTHLTLPTKA